METKNLFAAIIGRPNVGKSTLLNTLLGEKISIVSSKPQTTRTKITGILTKGETQYVFIDTPGIHKPRTKLGDYMMEKAGEAAGEVDIILFLVEAGDKIGPTERELMKKFTVMRVPALLIVNKTDKSNAREIGDTILRFSEVYDFAAVVPISAKNGENTDIIIDEISKFAQEGPHFFPDDMITDQPERIIASEIIREKILLTLSDEIPHGVAVGIERWHEREDGLVEINAVIYCEKASHKGIIIGKQGAMLKKIGTEARIDMENLLGSKIMLQLWVKVREDWRNKMGDLRTLGYDSTEEQ